MSCPSQISRYVEIDCRDVLYIEYAGSSAYGPFIRGTPGEAQSRRSLSVPSANPVTVSWAASHVTTDNSDVKLKSGPKKVKKFHSDAAAADFSYKRKLKVKGKYTVICTFHEGMTMTITVK